MIEQLLLTPDLEDGLPIVAIEELITEDETPVDNILSERQMRLLTDTLYASWSGPGNGRPFIALANVGLFATPRNNPLVPDVMVSLDVTLPDELMEKSHRSYFIWEYGKPPEVVIEIVSNKKGGEAGIKMARYARMGVQYYVIFDPAGLLSLSPLRTHVLSNHQYIPLKQHWLADVGLGFQLWYGSYEGTQETLWLRWIDEEGQLLPTKSERLEQEYYRAEQEYHRAERLKRRLEQERSRAEQEKQRAERLVAQLRALGIDPIT